MGLGVPGILVYLLGLLLKTAVWLSGLMLLMKCSFPGQVAAESGQGSAVMHAGVIVCLFRFILSLCSSSDYLFPCNFLLISSCLVQNHSTPPPKKNWLRLLMFSFKLIVPNINFMMWGANDSDAPKFRFLSLIKIQKLKLVHWCLILLSDGSQRQWQRLGRGNRGKDI